MVDDVRGDDCMTPAERKGVAAAAVMALIGLGVIATVTAALAAAVPTGAPLSVRAWSHVVLGYLIGAACLAFVGWFSVCLVRQTRSSRRFSDPFGDGDRAAVAAAAAGADLAAVRAVLFVSPRDIGRSRLAAAYLHALTLGTHRIDAAGVAPDPSTAPPLARNEAFIVSSLDRVDFDTRRPPQRATAGTLDRVDLVVRIGCPDAFPVPSYLPVQDWDVADPVGADLDTAFGIRDDIKRRVEELAERLGLANRSLDLRDRVIPGMRQVLAAGRAATPYPETSQGDIDASWLFALAEARLLVQIADAPETAAAINARGDQRPDFVVPWLLSAGAAASSLERELEWRAVGASPRSVTAEESVARVVDWLVDQGAVRPFSTEQRAELQRSGRAQRRIDDPPEQWPTGLAGEYPHRAEQRAAEEDLATWEVVPDRMLAVYPDLDVDGKEWAAVANRFR